MFSTSQFISLFILLAGIITVLFCGYLEKKRQAAVDNKVAEEPDAGKKTTESTEE